MLGSATPAVPLYADLRACGKIGLQVENLDLAQSCKANAGCSPPSPDQTNLQPPTGREILLTF
jgi:hypothetical protein